MTCLLLLIAGVVIGYLYKSKSESSEGAQEKKVLYWISPMDPTYRRDTPGKSPMGMDLVPVYNEDSQDGGIKISPVVEHNLGVRIVKAKIEDISKEINTVGTVAVDENLVEYTHVYADGWIKELLVKTENEQVEKGQLLFRIYSPRITVAQDEYLLSLENKNVSLQESAVKKLQSLGVSVEQIKSLKESRKSKELIDVYADQSGVVSKLNIAEGMFVKPDHILMVVEDLSKIWLIAEVYERESSWVKVGQKAEMTLPYVPGKVWSGDVSYIYPTIDAHSKTLQVRMSFENPLGDLKLNMYGDVKIYSDPQKDALVIPKEAVIYTGSETRVVVKGSNGKYSTHPIKLGSESNEVIQVLEGLKEGDEVVASAQFLIDSESNLNASLKRMETKDASQQKMMHQH